MNDLVVKKEGEKVRYFLEVIARTLGEVNKPQEELQLLPFKINNKRYYVLNDEDNNFKIYCDSDRSFRYQYDEVVIANMQIRNFRIEGNKVVFTLSPNDHFLALPDGYIGATIGNIDEAARRFAYAICEKNDGKKDLYFHIADEKKGKGVWQKYECGLDDITIYNTGCYIATYSSGQTIAVLGLGQEKFFHIPDDKILGDYLSNYIELETITKKHSFSAPRISLLQEICFTEKSEYANEKWTRVCHYYRVKGNDGKEYVMLISFVPNALGKRDCYQGIYISNVETSDYNQWQQNLNAIEFSPFKPLHENYFLVQATPNSKKGVIKTNGIMHKEIVPQVYDVIVVALNSDGKATFICSNEAGKIYYDEEGNSSISPATGHQMTHKKSGQ